MVKRILGPIFGFLLGIFLAVDFIIFGVIAFDSVLVVVLPVVGLVLGGVLAFTSPLGKTSTVGTGDIGDTIAEPQDGCRRDRQSDRQLQEFLIEQDLVVVDAADGVAVELAALRADINCYSQTTLGPHSAALLLLLLSGQYRCCR
ncbi:hypothetical protein OAV42_01815 [Ilumatobacter sp.]|nr:hypothetical protein [Ilumatobacter sp.]